jgi:hypothetical protein
MQPSPPKAESVRAMFRTTFDYRETLYLQPNSGRIPLGIDLEKYSFECSMFWVKDRLQLLVMVGVDGKTIDISRTMGHLRMVNISLDSTATTVEVWAFARMAILIGLGSDVEISEVKQEPDGSRVFPISHWVDDTGRATCPLCQVAIPGRIPIFPVGRVVRCPACKVMILNQNQQLRCKPAAV